MLDQREIEPWSNFALPNRSPWRHGQALFLHFNSRNVNIHTKSQTQSFGLKTRSIAMALPQEVLNDCIAVFPSFRNYWEDNGCYFKDDDGSFNACVVFLLLTWLISERFKRLSVRQWSRLGLLAKYFDLGEPTRGMLGACLIEHLEGRDFSGEVLQHFDRDLLRHYGFGGVEA